MGTKIKRILVVKCIIGILFTFSSCSSTNDDELNFETETEATEWRCGTHNGNELYTGPRRGCYYYNSNGNKTYVERKECNC